MIIFYIGYNFYFSIETFGVLSLQIGIIKYLIHIYYLHLNYE